MRKHLIHINSMDASGGQAKLPPIEEVEYGELVVNYGSGHETIMLKNSDDEIISFKSDRYYSGTYATIQYVDEKIAEGGGGIFTGITEDITELSGYAETHTSQISELSGASHSHANKTVLDGIDEEKITQWDAAEKNVISAISVNNAPLLINNKGVNIDLSRYATQSYVDERIVEIVGGGTIELDGYAKVEDVAQDFVNALQSAQTFANAAETDAVASAKTYIDTKIQASGHVHSNKTELDKIQDGDVAKWNASEADAVASSKSYTDAAFTSAYTNALASGSGYTDAVVAAAKTELQGKIDTLSGVSHSHENKDELDKIQDGDVEKWNAAEADAVASSKSYTDAAFTSAYTNAVSSASSHADTAITAAKTEVYDSAKTYTDTEIASLVGSDTGKTIREIATDELAAQLIPSGAQQSLDTLQEIADWIQSHPDDASAMNTDIRRVSGWVMEVSAHVATIETTIANLDSRIQQVISTYIKGATNQISITDGGAQITVAFDENAIFGDKEEF